MRSNKIKNKLDKNLKHQYLINQVPWRNKQRFILILFITKIDKINVHLKNL